MRRSRERQRCGRKTLFGSTSCHDHGLSYAGIEWSGSVASHSSEVPWCAHSAANDLRLDSASRPGQEARHQRLLFQSPSRLHYRSDKGPFARRILLSGIVRCLGWLNLCPKVWPRCFKNSGEVMGEARILIYRYLEDDSEDEEADLTGQIEMPRTGDIVYRKEKVWRVTGVYALPLTDPIRRFRIHLLDMSKPEFVN
jgi:hypothetical protein